MNIRIEETDDDKKIAYLEGEINTNTAKELESALDEEIAIADDLILDFAGVPYISSAGLRVLMKWQKELSKLGSMTLCNVSDEVYEVFKMVKLDKILTFEGRAAATAATGNEDSVDLDAYEVEEYTLNEDDIELLPPRVQQLYRQDKLKALAAEEDGENRGFVVYQETKSKTSAYVMYVYVREEARGKGVALCLIKNLEKDLLDQGIEELYLTCLAGVEGDQLAEKLCYEKTNKVKHIIQYNKKQILSSPMWKQIGKLRGMFDKVRIFDELDYMEQMALEQMMGEDDFEAIDTLYARIYSSDGEITGLLNAQEVTENNIWITNIIVQPSKDANVAPVLMLGSLLDAVVTLLEDDDKIQIVNSKEGLAKSYQQILGQPLKNLQDTFYKKALS